MNVLAEAVAGLQEALEAADGKSITYHRGASSLPLVAVVGRTLFEEIDESGIVRQVESRDFLVLRERLVMNGEPTLPARGDQIRELVAGRAFVYEVLSRNGEPQYRFSDGHRVRLRIHTKLIATELVG